MKKWEENVRKVVPYVAGEQPKESNIIKLNTNENPYPPSPSVFAASKELDVNRFALYPDTSADLLVTALADYHNVNKDQVFVGVGSDDVLALAFLTFFNSTKPILFPDITYSFYPVWAQVYQIPYKNPAVDENYHIVTSDYFQENGGIVIANPNAPTSIQFPVSSIEEILQKNPDVVVIIDEAYVDFGGETSLSLVEKYDNLLVVRTYSKSRSMAGMRIGYAIGNSSLICAMMAVKESINSYTMNMASISLGAASIKDEEYFQENISKIIKTRERVTTELKKFQFEVLESKANFLFAKPTQISAKELFEELRKRLIYVRFFEKPRIDQYLRITIGTENEMTKLLEAIDEIQKNKKKV